MVKRTENSRERRNRLCGMFLDYWLDESTAREGKLLLVGSGLHHIVDAANSGGRRTTWWSWFPEKPAQHESFPPEELFSEAIVRMPPEKERLKFCLELVASRLKPGAHLWLFGANDEGIRSADKLGAPFFDRGVTVSARKHARLLCFTRLDAGQASTTLASFKKTAQLKLGSTEYQWHHFPGTFAKGRLDHGSRLLLESFNPQINPERVLDFGCGTGVLVGLSRLTECDDIHMLDRDFIALEATKLNVPQAQLHWSNRWLDDQRLQFDLIMSNPPIHDGKVEDHSMVQKLIEDARRSLRQNGELWMVVQHRVAVEKMLQGYFGHFEIRGQNSVFKVWRIVQEGSIES